MKLLPIASFFIMLQIASPLTKAQNVWNGAVLTFSKANFANPTLAANQDRLTNAVWITRADRFGIFNIHNESSYASTSPNDTEWAYGTINNYASLTYAPWVTWCNANPPGTINLNAVLHLKTENIYVAVKFLSWTANAEGGGFSYQRSTPTTLPLSLLSFSGQAIGKKITLNWVTAQEQNSWQFAIENSTDGINYHVIGSVAAAGHSADDRSYSFSHNTSSPGINYYRLKQSDLDHKYTYSKVIRVTVVSQEISISFIPSTSMIHFAVPTGKAIQVQVFSGNGVLVKKDQFSSATATLNITALPRGAYIIRVTANGNTVTKEIIKN